MGNQQSQTGGSGQFTNFLQNYCVLRTKDEHQAGRTEGASTIVDLRGGPQIRDSTEPKIDIQIESRYCVKSGGK